MGIRGLLTMIKDGCTLQVVDLVEEARAAGGIEILVDFDAVIRFVIKSSMDKMVLDYKNEYLQFPVGVYDVLAEAIGDFHRGFEEAGIRLVWVVDGPRGVDEQAGAQKSGTWLKRHKETISVMEDELKCARFRLPRVVDERPYATGVMESGQRTLKKAGAEIINLLQGEGDEFIAYEFHRRKSFAIFTNDTDFVIFRDCVVIFLQMLSFCYEYDDMNLPFMDFENPGKIFKTPSSLRCPLVKQEHILRLLQLDSPSQLIALSIFKGNDYTAKYLDELMPHLQITKSPNNSPNVTKVAQYINRRSITSDNMEDLPEMKDFLVKYPQFRESIQFCKDLYSLRRLKDHLGMSIAVYDPSTNDDSLTGFLARKISNGEIFKTAYAAHFGIVLDSIYPESPRSDCPPILTLLLEIRKRLYPYLLHERYNEVVEWRSRSEDHLHKVPVIHAEIKTNMIKSKPEEGDSQSERYGIDLFEEVICHLEEDGPLSLVSKYGIEKAFILHTLRYMFLLTKGRNLKLTEKEFKGLFVTVLFQYSRSEGFQFGTRLRRHDFLGMKICPSVRCLITGTWFMVIFLTGKYFCGATFNLTEDFPEPSKVMSGPTFYAFYENLMCETNSRTGHLPDSLVQSLGDLEREVMAKYEQEYKVVTTGRA